MIFDKKNNKIAENDVWSMYNNHDGQPTIYSIREANIRDGRKIAHVVFKYMSKSLPTRFPMQRIRGYIHKKTT
jgi:hypothetical protein